jgi:hypothetical protein
MEFSLPTSHTHSRIPFYPLLLPLTNNPNHLLKPPHPQSLNARPAPRPHVPLPPLHSLRANSPPPHPPLPHPRSSHRLHILQPLQRLHLSCPILPAPRAHLPRLSPAHKDFLERPRDLLRARDTHLRRSNMGHPMR